MKHAREKLGQPCEMCHNYELQLQQVQTKEVEQRLKASAIEQTLEDYKKDLKKEQEYRQEMEEKFNDMSKDCDTKVRRKGEATISCGRILRIVRVKNYIFNIYIILCNPYLVISLF